MTRPRHALGFASFFGLALMAGTIQAQDAPSTGSVPDQATITEDYQALETPAATRLPAPPRPAPPAAAPASEPRTPSGDSAADLNQSWRNFQVPRRISRTSPNSYSYGYGSYPEGESTWGYRNPGGVGRTAEYYPPDDQFQNGGPHNYVAQFDQGPAATQRGAQFQAESLGIAKYNAIQGHIDRYGMPRIGFGWGLGFGMFPY
ncbi:MAG TPA: hypothetical protein VFT74_12530 [Isosphaeraceae bacterium]|nr:hypothetical protein [Isosphaeraceae bacterium]